MASALTTCYLSTPIRASYGSGAKNPDYNRVRASSSSASTNWWAPIFGLSSDPDYITNASERKQSETADSGQLRSRFAPGCFTEEKAKQLRRKTMESSTFHDVMYHSAIASRLASDISVFPRSGRLCGSPE